jgi:hypothetical protein
MSQKQNQEPKDEISSTITMTSSSISDLWGFYENIINKKYSNLGRLRWYTHVCGISKQSTSLVRGLWFAEPHMRLNGMLPRYIYFRLKELFSELHAKGYFVFGFPSLLHTVSQYCLSQLPTRLGHGSSNPSLTAWPWISCRMRWES